ncbi:NADPH-dependent FMN reductase [Sporosarcina pasteurii]|uniref:NADPH azoreductase n=1 Tax=Sporosarcina pasteurii TaxID=1474 RepID=A0A380BBC4_SPOPA|nr:NADPH-dependent FMN reductase [Sporosarcina pasteurii]MDS9472891.1 NADPH-dependent FMN reductase [Sporosarcina pasteurii]QBQ06439.1 NAD(P)H-dependent oxidoreductase [Sporosarcina pasteurii]SUI98482.1 NADPH azoreductase [Sporosarcina pasteurii]
MKVIALIGSLREDSYNRQLIETIEKRYHTMFNLEVAPIGKLPFYNEDEEMYPPKEVEKFKKMIEDADAVFISTPEFNWSISGVLKNALDWLSRVEKPIAKKPVLLMGVSQGGLGTIRAQLHARQILTSVGAVMMPAVSNEILIGGAGQKFENGELTHEVTLQYIDEVMERFLEFVKKEQDQ